eukprot:g7282.t1
MHNQQHAGPSQVINPESTKYATYWQFVTFAAMIFVAFVTPVQVGLFPMRIDGLMIFSLCVDAVFLADMVLQFFTMYPKRCLGRYHSPGPWGVILPRDRATRVSSTLVTGRWQPSEGRSLRQFGGLDVWISKEDKSPSADDW